MGEAPSAGLALRTALERAEMSAADIDLFDFYSCFPIAVSNAIAGLGVDPADPRGLTLTGGLPYFGGPGNSYLDARDRRSGCPFAIRSRGFGADCR